MSTGDCDCADCRPPAYVPRPYARDEDPARELADLWASVLPGEPAEQTCG